MATSGSVNYTDTTTTIINDTLALLTKYGEGQTPSDSDFQLCKRFLNRMIKQWQASGISVWATQQVYIFPQYNQPSYTLGSNYTVGGDHATVTPVITYSTTDAASSATTITLNTVTGMTVNDNIGILLDDGTRFWTTITNINTGTKVVTFTDALTDTATSGNSVFTYTTKIAKPLRFKGLRRADITGSTITEIPLEPFSNQQYFDQINKLELGLPVQYYYQPGVSSGTLYVWQNPQDASNYLVGTILREFEDMDNTGDSPDFPQEWQLPIIYNLAVLVSPAFGMKAKGDALKVDALTLLEEVKTFDVGQGSYYIKASSK